MPPQRPVLPTTRAGRTSPLSEQPVRLAPCVCAPDTPAPNLCETCHPKRRRILDRARRRRDRGGAEAGGTHLDSHETAELLQLLDNIANQQIALEDRARLTGRPLSRKLDTLFTTLAQLRDALQPAFNERGEEQIELDRPGGSPRIGTRFQKRKPSDG